jgi:serine/threonine protein kinase
VEEAAPEEAVSAAQEDELNKKEAAAASGASGGAAAEAAAAARSEQEKLLAEEAEKRKAAEQEADMAEEEREAAGAHDEAHWCYAQDGDGGGDEDPGQDEVASAAAASAEQEAAAREALDTAQAQATATEAFFLSLREAAASWPVPGTPPAGSAQGPATPATGTPPDETRAPCTKDCAQAAAGAEAAAPAAAPAFDAAPYAKMLKVGLPEAHVRQRMQAAGVGAADTDALFSSLQSAAAPAAAPALAPNPFPLAPAAALHTIHPAGSMQEALQAAAARRAAAASASAGEKEEAARQQREKESAVARAKQQADDKQSAELVQGLQGSLAHMLIAAASLDGRRGQAQGLVGADPGAGKGKQGGCGEGAGQFVLGEGKFALVFRAVWKPALSRPFATAGPATRRRLVAVKEFKHKSALPPPMVVLEFAKEARVLDALPSHPNVMRVYGVLLQPRLQCVTEFLPWGSVHDHVSAAALQAGAGGGGAAAPGGFPVGGGGGGGGWAALAVRERAGVGLGVARALVHLKRHRFLHRDVKSHNALLWLPEAAWKDNGKDGDGGAGKDGGEAAGAGECTGAVSAKLCDLGSAKQLQTGGAGGARTFTQVGTSGHTAPEVFAEGTGYGWGADVWSLGVFLWELVSDLPAQGGGRLANPFTGLNPDDYVARLQSGERLALPPAADAQYAQLVRRCGAWRAEDRPTVEQVVSALEVYCDGGML